MIGEIANKLNVPEGILKVHVIALAVKEEELHKQIKELNQRIAELEGMVAQLMAPIKEMQKTSQKYLRIVDLALTHGGLSPEILLPEVKDPISKDIVSVLIDKGGRNISQVTEAVRLKRGTASRRIIRERLKVLEERDIIEQGGRGSVSTYHISEEVLRKWSQLLGINI